ncbi:MAG TPA: serine hydrolase domain-containing protein [Vicinamibacterales bacterium]|nr:serine hydrolase domain-containing protein [Vicinamibacterales bacterium]
MKAFLSARSCSYRGALRPVLCGLLALVAIGAATATAQSGGALVQRLDSIAGAGVLENRSVGVVAAAVKGKDTLLLNFYLAYGKADVEGDVPTTVDTVFPIGSDTKQFTAAAILQLRDQGKLSLDDDITKWLPDFETRGNKVTLRHLLGHTSGIVDIVEMPELRTMQLMRNPTVTRDAVYTVISRYPFAFPTGSMQTYSNSGFWLLGLIIEKASGMTYEEYIEKRIFEPLGMTRSMYCNNSESVPRRAYGYGMRSGVPRRVPEIVHTGTYAAGALCSTAEDLITWLQALHGGKVLTPKSYVEMITPSTLNDGTRLRYSMGLFVGEDSRGLRYIGHDGGGFGFSSQTRWYLDAPLAVVVLTNSEPDDTTAIAENLAAAVLPVPPPASPFTGDASLLVGTYKGLGRGRDMVIEVTQTPQGIAFAFDGVAAGPLPWVEGWTFRRDSSVLTFRRSGISGPATELRYDRGGGHFILKRQ